MNTQSTVKILWLDGLYTKFRPTPQLSNVLRSSWVGQEISFSILLGSKWCTGHIEDSNIDYADINRMLMYEPLRKDHEWWRKPTGTSSWIKRAQPPPYTRPFI